MIVKLIDYTGCGTDYPDRHAAAVLIFTKSTRLEMKNLSIDEISSWSSEKLNNELAYISRTIPSSWEFVHYTYLIGGVTRAFTHQLVRTRTASFAQQTMRILNQSGFDYLAGPTVDDHGIAINKYDATMSQIQSTYDELIGYGVAIEDARGILPTNILTNICMSANLRTVVELVRGRSSPRVQGEYRNFLDKLVSEIEKVHPWTKYFFDRTGKEMVKELESLVEDQDISKEDKTRIYKLVDEIRKS